MLASHIAQEYMRVDRFGIADEIGVPSLVDKQHHHRCVHMVSQAALPIRDQARRGPHGHV